MSEPNIGDSGYISNSANDNNFFQMKNGAADPEYISQTLDALLAPHSKPGIVASVINVTGMLFVFALTFISLFYYSILDCLQTKAA